MLKQIIQILKSILKGVIIGCLISMVMYAGYITLTVKKDLLSLRGSLSQTQAWIEKQQSQTRIFNKLQIQYMKSIVDQNSLIIKGMIETVKEMEEIKKNVHVQKTILSMMEKDLFVPDYKKLQKSVFRIWNVLRGAHGSGSLIKYDGKFYILTANHVIADGDPNMLVAIDTTNGTQYKLTIKKTWSIFDLALLDIDIPQDVAEQNYLTIAHIEPKAGQEIYIFGHPGYFDDILVKGTISSKGLFTYLLDAAVYFGDSGGPIIRNGEIVGVVNALTFQNRPFPVPLPDELKLYVPQDVYYYDWRMGIGIRLRLIQTFLALAVQK
jgi:S1-C subfamily serine protease